jgi:hypothetical protein
MENRKPLNFAQALRSKPGRPPEPEPDAHHAPEVDAHTVPAETPTPESADAQPQSVDAKTPTLVPVVDAQPPTRHTSGRPIKKRVDAHKGDRHRGNKARQHFRIRPDLDEQFRLFRAKHRLELQEFYELAGAHFIECVDAKKEIGVDAVASLDDRDTMILFKTQPSIINLYLQYNPENRWKPADDAEGKRYNDSDIRLLEIGIIQTQFNARFKKIHSFKYYVTEIDIALETPLTEETITIMLKNHRRRWEEATK